MMFKGVLIIILSVALLIYSIYKGLILQKVEYRGRGAYLDNVFIIEGVNAVIIGIICIIISLCGIGFGVYLVRKSKDTPMW